MTASPTMQLTGGTSTAELSREIRSQKGAKQFLEVDWEREGISWVELASENGRPSGMVRN